MSLIPERPSSLAGQIPWDKLWAHVAGQFPLGQHSLHGPSHWRRVESNGLLIAQTSGADLTVVRLFALFHDSRRENEFTDDSHGRRGAELARRLHGVEFHLDEPRLSLLIEACEGHTDLIHHSDKTIATCWDADRLDLPRVGITPDPERLNTAKAKELCRADCLIQLTSEASPPSSSHPRSRHP